MIITRHWFRFWRNGPGIAWTREYEPMSFSERYGYTRTVILFGVRFKWLSRCR